MFAVVGFTIAISLLTGQESKSIYSVLPKYIWITMLTPMQKQKRLAFHAAAFSILLNSIQKDTDKYAQVDEAMEKIEGFYELIQQLRNSY